MHVRRTALLSALTLLGALATLPGPANAADSTVRPDQLNCAETRTAGHNDVGASDVHVYTDDNTSQAKAACYFTLTGALPTNASMLWADNGNDTDTARPGQQLVFDGNGIPGDGISDYNILVGEPVYGDNWWLTSGSSAEAKAADPSGTENGGNGSEWFGTLAEWSAAMPDATSLAGGWSLGSGVKGDGWVKSLTYGPDTYTFTNTEPHPATTPVVPRVTAQKFKNEQRETMRFTYQTADRQDGQSLARKVTLTVKLDGHRVEQDVVGFGAELQWRHDFRKGTGTHVATLHKDGQIIRTVRVHTGLPKGYQG